jgi:hypothetical protein
MFATVATYLSVAGFSNERSIAFSILIVGALSVVILVIWLRREEEMSRHLNRAVLDMPEKQVQEAEGQEQQSKVELLWKSKTLADLSYDELWLEKTKLEAAEQNTLRNLQALEQEKTLLFEEAVRETLTVARQVKARRICDIDHRIKDLQNNIRQLGKLIQLVDLTIALLQQGWFQSDPNLFARIMGQTDSLRVHEWVNNVISGEAVAEQKLDEVLKVFGDAELMQSGVATGDAEVDAILVEIQRTAAIGAFAAEEHELKGDELDDPSYP